MQTRCATLKKKIVGIFNFWKNKQKAESLKEKSEPYSEYLNINIDLQNKTQALNGTVEYFWFENKNTSIEKTQFHKIIIPLKPFDSGIEYESQPTDTWMIIDWLDLGLTNPKKIDGIQISSDKDSQTEGSIYIGNTYNPFDIKNITFKKVNENKYQVIGELMIDFEHEMVAKNEDFNFQTTVEFKLTE